MEVSALQKTLSADAWKLVHCKKQTPNYSYLSVKSNSQKEWMVHHTLYVLFSAVALHSDRLLH
jgi:hypothetical protein